MNDLIKKWSEFKKEYVMRFSLNHNGFQFDEAGNLYSPPTFEKFLDWLETKEEV